MGHAKRTYGDACGVARALDLVGERWALMAVRELLLGPKRFTDLRDGLPHVSADVLAQRLRDLEQAGIVARRTLAPPAASKVYELTDWGRDLEDVVLALGRFGAQLPAPPPDMGMSIDAHLLSMRTLFSPVLAGDLDVRVDLHLGDQRFTTAVADRSFTVARGEHDAPDAVLTTDPGTLIDVLHGRRDVGDAIAAGDLEVSGDRRRVARYLQLFPLPDVAPTALDAAVAAAADHAVA
jgi:DNA-binding HxlR family transcriptional regulator/putative sterol carrier protein